MDLLGRTSCDPFRLGCMGLRIGLIWRHGLEGFAWSRSSPPFAWVCWVSDRIDLASWVEGFCLVCVQSRLFAWGAWVSDRIDLASWVEGFAWSGVHRTGSLGAHGFSGIALIWHRG